MWGVWDVEYIVYDQGQMRRFVSIVFLLLCSLGPLSALLPGSAESQLPACCRRHGVHHCAMAMAEQGSGGGHVVSAPSRCPQFHRSSPATRGAFAPPATSALVHTAEDELLIAAERAATLHQARTTADRGPPTIL